MKTIIMLILALLTIFLFANGCRKDENDNNVVKDIEGNLYHTVRIGNQVWMVENLRTTKYNDGTEIVHPSDSAAWNHNTTGAFCWYPGIDNTDKMVYGALYNQYSVKTGRLAPGGWHVSTLQDWIALTEYLGGESVAGGFLKESGFTHWCNPNTGATNQSGFTALPGGYTTKINFNNIGGFNGMTYTGIWWTPSESEGAPDYMYAFEIDYFTREVFRYGRFASSFDGFSVRCVKDPDLADLAD
jgi:uncharacterized protein (TIGR02145 family)